MKTNLLSSTKFILPWGKDYSRSSISEVYIAREAKFTLFLSSTKFIKHVEHKDYTLPSNYEVYIARRA